MIVTPLYTKSGLGIFFADFHWVRLLKQNNRAWLAGGKLGVFLEGDRNASVRRGHGVSRPFKSGLSRR